MDGYRLLTNKTGLIDLNHATTRKGGIMDKAGFPGVTFFSPKGISRFA